MDLTPLEAAAARAGRPGLHARLVPADPRRGRWFALQGSELLVNERVVERLNPGEGQALIINTVLQWKHLARHRRQVALLLAALVVVVVLLAGAQLAPALVTVAGALLSLTLLVLIFVGWSRAMLAADDESVTLLGDAEVLVRSLNVMSQDRLDLGKNRVAARPDLHRRAERLVTLHELRLPPEKRSVPVLNSTTSCGVGWDTTGAALGGDSTPGRD